jgi:DNA primase
VQSAIEQIRQNLSIAQAWHVLDLPGIAAKECKSPFRQDKRASLSIYRAADGERYYDHGLGQGGDVINFWAEARGLSVKAAIEDIIRQMPSLEASGVERGSFERVAAEGIRWPSDLREPTEAECRALGELRGLGPSVFDLAGKLGTLKVARVYGALAWIITDSSGICAEARRFDGEFYEKKNGERLKSFALPGSHKYWPVGLQTNSETLNAAKRIVLVEGGPDYFAALELCAAYDLENRGPGSIRPMALLGAGTNLGPEAGQFIKDAEVVIIPHNDPAGVKAGDRWTEQLIALGAQWVQIEPLPFEFDDLNEFLCTKPPDRLGLLKEFK